MSMIFPTNRNLLSKREIAWFVGAFFALMFLFSVEAHCKVYDVDVVSVHDGDSLRLSFGHGFEFDARLHGIDAPELDQNFGLQCKAKLEELVQTSKLQIWIVTEDTYNRKIVKLLRPNFAEINLEMIAVGCAWTYSPRRSERDRYRKAFADAYKSKLNLFSSEKFCEPYKWRKGTCKE